MAAADLKHPGVNRLTLEKHCRGTSLVVGKGHLVGG